MGLLCSGPDDRSVRVSLIEESSLFHVLIRGVTRVAESSVFSNHDEHRERSCGTAKFADLSTIAWCVRISFIGHGANRWDRRRSPGSVGSNLIFS